MERETGVNLMECPYCDSELEQIDTWWLGIPGKGKRMGGIYVCPVGSGQDEKPMAERVAERLRYGYDGCPSAVFSVAGSFYTDKNGELHEGYPC